MAAPTADIDPDIWTRIVELAGGRLVIPQTEVCRALGNIPALYAPQIQVRVALVLRLNQKVHAAQCGSPTNPSVAP